MTWSFLDVFKYHRQNNKSRPRHAATAEVKAINVDGTVAWRFAAVCYDESTGENVVARDVIAMVGSQIYPLDKEMRSAPPTPNEVNGYTELEWCFAEQPRKIYKSIFLVSSDYSPRYDLILGNRDAKQAHKRKSRKTAG